MAEVEYTISCTYIMQNIENLITGIIVPLNELKVVKLFEILNLHLHSANRPFWSKLS